MNLDLLRDAELFRGFADGDIAAFAAASVVHHADTGHVFFEFSQTNRSLFLVVNGSVRVTRPGAGGAEVDLAILGHGQSFGEMSLLDGSPTHGTITAAEPAQVLEVSRDALEKLLAQRPMLVAQIWHNIALELKQRLARMNDIVEHYADLNRQLLATQRA